MTLSLAVISAWVFLAFVIQSLPTKDRHWRMAYVLIVIGLPLVVWVTWRSGPLFGGFAVMIGCLVLRWPVYYFYRRISWLWRK